MKRFIDRMVGEEFEIDTGGGSWLAGRKTGNDEFTKLNSYVIGVSAWTKTRDYGKPLIEVLDDE